MAQRLCKDEEKLASNFLAADADDLPRKKSSNDA
jgi:hypothetical protein